MNALGVEIGGENGKIGVAGALAISEQAALDAISARKKRSSAAATPVPRSL